MSETNSVARPYAKAAFEFANEHQAIDKWEQMLTFLSTCVEHKEVQAAIKAANSPQKSAQLITSLCEDELDEFGKNFAYVMAENKRLLVLPLVLKAFKQLRNDFEKTKKVVVKSAFSLTDDALLKIKTGLEKKLNTCVDIELLVDQSLIAGVVISYDDIVIDASSRGQLNRLASSLI